MPRRALLAGLMADGPDVGREATHGLVVERSQRADAIAAMRAMKLVSEASVGDVRVIVGGGGPGLPGAGADEQ